uniref:Uncharacterized protein n=1 Tax=Alexandrium catenella TaxID=2925 RepID=A0A7S1RVV0_ALECA
MPWTAEEAEEAEWPASKAEDLGHAELILRVKELCRSNPVAKRQWCTWCDSFQGGTKDPSRIDDVSLRTFLTDFEVGSTPAAPPTAATKTSQVGAQQSGKGTSKGAQEQPDLAEAVKVGQRTSSSFKNAWVAFCQMQGHKSFDPARHTKEFLSSYFEFVGEQALATMPAPQTTPALPAAKRPRTVPSPGGGGALALPKLGDAGSDPSVAALAERVKQVQRQDPMKWQLWSEYCDAEYNGTKDPSRHTAESLQGFLDNCETS